MLKNILLVVSDMERSKTFYQEYFGLRIINDFGDNVILTGGLVLQEQKSWEQLTGSSIVIGNASELFFAEDDFDAFLLKIENYMRETNQILEVRKNSWGRRAVLLKDFDGHLLEAAER